MSNGQHPWWWITSVSSGPDHSPEPPVTPTVLEGLRVCPLARCYARSTSGRFLSRVAPSARIGTAVHSTIDELPAVAAAAANAPECAQSARDLFRSRIAAQQTASAENPRERTLRWPEERLFEAENTIIRLARLAFLSRGTQTSSGTQHHEFELRLESRDGLIAGILDHLEHSPAGTRIIDYKTALTLDDIDKHRRQLLLYAYLFCDTTGHWPISLTLDYVLMRKRIGVDVDQNTAALLATEAREAASTLPYRLNNLEILAKPGPACHFCSYRPWCQPFWNAVQQFDLPLCFTGIEGIVSSRQEHGSRVLIVLEGASHVYDVRGDLDSMEQLATVKPGTRIRVLDATVCGVVTRPSVDLTDRAEVFVVGDGKDGRE